ncbi:MAG: hypothetical protein FWC68_00655 [Oscillospiraceae bacterium]|nr:hypothetical protein [Oscillospiraceae bacterium]
MNSQEKFNSFRTKYPVFRYKNYNIAQNEEGITLTYNFEIDGLAQFSPNVTINVGVDDSVHPCSNDQNFNLIAFNIGLIELISYWKSTCSPQIIIECGNIDEKQILWFKKLYYYGLGEFFYINGIKTNIQDFVEIKCTNTTHINYEPTNQNLQGTLIPIGGGKDSCVTMELLKDIDNKYCIMINPKEVSLECSRIAGFDETNTVIVHRQIDKNLIELNKQGYLNGHTPFSSLLAFITYAVSYLLNIQYIALSNESSANESNVIGEKVNHQYSKTYEFENDFKEYCENYLDKNIEYFSFLRPLNELQIAKLFSKYKQYHKTFKSCNVGSKEKEWKWCCNCPKCLFVYIILSPFLSKEELIEIFGEDLYEKPELLDTFLELAGKSNIKPFECVGTFEEVNYAITQTITKLQSQQKQLPHLLNHYNKNYELQNHNHELLNNYNEFHNIPEELKKFMIK